MKPFVLFFFSLLISFTGYCQLNAYPASPGDSILLYESLYLKNLASECIKERNVKKAVSLLLYSLPKNLDNPERPLVEEALNMLYDIHYNEDIHASVINKSSISINFSKVFSEKENQFKVSDPFPKAYLAQKSNCGNYVAIVPAGRRSIIEIWNLNTKEFVARRKSTETIYNIGFSPDDTELYVYTLNQLLTVGGVPKVFSMHHSSNILDVEISPDGKLIATSGYDNLARVWDAETGKEFCKPLVHDIKAVDYVEFSPCGRYLLTLPYKSNKVHIWDLATGEELEHGISVPLGYFYSAKFSPCGNYILTSSNYIQLNACLWDFSRKGVLSKKFPVNTSVIYAAISPNGRFAATSSAHRTIQVWDLDNEAAPHSYKEVSSFSTQSLSDKILFSPCNSKVAVVSRDFTARILDVETGIQTGKDMVHKGKITNMAFNSTGDRIVTVSTDSTAIVWDAVSGEPILPPFRHNGSVSQACFAGNDKYLVVACWDGNIVVWNIVDGKQAQSYMRHNRRVQHVELSSDGRFIVSGSLDKSARRWNFLSPQELLDHYRNDTTINCKLGNKELHKYHIGDYSSEELVKSRYLYTEAKKYYALKDTVKAVSYLLEALPNKLSKGEGKYAPEALQLLCKIYNKTAGKGVDLGLKKASVVKYTPDGKYILAGTEDGFFHVIDASSYKKVASLHLAVKIIDLSSDPQSRTVALLLDDGTIRVQDLKDFTSSVAGIYHRGADIISFSNSGKMLLTYRHRHHNKFVDKNKGKTAKLWDVSSGELVAESEILINLLLKARFSSDDKSLIFSNFIGGNIHVLSIDEPVMRYDSTSFFINKEGIFSPDGSFHLKIFIDYFSPENNIIKLYKSYTDKEIYNPLEYPYNFKGILFCNKSNEIAFVAEKIQKLDIRTGVYLSAPLQYLAEDSYSVGFTGYSEIRKGYDELVLYNNWNAKMFQLKSFQEVLDIMRRKYNILQSL